MFDFLINSVNWREPLWLLVALQPLFLWLVLRWFQQRKQQQFADSHLLPWLQVHEDKTIWQGFYSTLFSRNSAYFLAWFLLALSLAGPRLPDSPKHKQNEIVLDVMLVVDLSRSMLATDVQPSRLRRATLEAYDFLSLAKNTRIGITVYSARPHLYVPLTSDFKALKFYLKNLDVLQLPTLGGDASTALSFAHKELINTDANHKQVLLWLSDGDIQSDKFSDIEKSIISAANVNIDTYILGLGTLEGSAIPLADGSWLESEGQPVITRTTKTNTQQLQQLAEQGNGRFSMVKNDNSDWDSLYHQGMLTTLATPKNTDEQQWQELFPWALFPAILLLIIALFPFNFVNKHSVKTNIVTGLIMFVFLISNFTTSPVIADEKKYKSSVLIGIDAYKNAEFVKSKRQFIQSVLTADTHKERGVALHNLGNALFQTGDYSSAAEVFTDALRYAPEQQASIENQKLSIEIYTLIEKRRNRLMNRGNFAAPDDIAPLFDLPEQIPYILSSKAVMLLKASLPDLPEEELDRLLSKEMQQFQLMQGDKTQSLEEQKQQEMEEETEQARIHFMGLEETNSNDLWKRLFEIEEGFPARLKNPKPLPGVRPW